jgi:hypothetical protein
MLFVTPRLSAKSKFMQNKMSIVDQPRQIKLLTQPVTFLQITLACAMFANNTKLSAAQIVDFLPSKMFVISEIRLAFI